jgi:hypothetical protein
MSLVWPPASAVLYLDPSNNRDKPRGPCASGDVLAKKAEVTPELGWVAAGCRLQRMESPLPSPGMPRGF